MIEAANMAICYGTCSVLNGLTFRVGAGEFVSIVGKSGVGKSSLLHALAGFIPHEGTLRAPRHFGFVFQASHAVFPFRTAAGNVRLGLRSLPKKKRESATQEILSLVGLHDVRNRYPGQLSGGQVQRIAVARALARVPSPEIIYCDEPFSALDELTRDQMQELILELWGLRHTAVLFVTHSVEEAVYLGSRVLVMRNGTFSDDVEVNLPRPRDRSIKFSAAFQALRQRILVSMGA